MNPDSTGAKVLQRLDSRYVNMCYNKSIESKRAVLGTALNMRKECFRMDTPDYITIPLSKTGKYAGKYEAIVSIEDAEYVKQFNWTVLRRYKRTEYTMYAVRKSYSPNNIVRTQTLHRTILARKLERELLPSEFVDHIDGDGLNNKRDNLRLATRSENGSNRRKGINNTSGYKGVTKCGAKWMAQIMKNGEQNYLGLFETEIDAYEAYCEAADKYHQDYANYGSES